MCSTLSNKKEKIKLICTVRIKAKEEINASLYIFNLLQQVMLKVQALKTVW